MLGLSITVVAGAGLIGLAAYHDYCAKGGCDWLLSALIISGLLLTVVLSAPAAALS